jgi:hypothetical protein
MRPTWEHIVFGAPYNELKPDDERLRFEDWSSWHGVLAKRLSLFNPIRERLVSSASSDVVSSMSTAAESDLSPRFAPSSRTTAEDVAHLRDFSAEIPHLKAIREDYFRWRTGGSAGMKGNIDSSASLKELIAEAAAVMEEAHQTEDNPQDVFVWRKQMRDTYRKKYKDWRKGKSAGAKSSALGLSPDVSRRDRALF